MIYIRIFLDSFEPELCFHHNQNTNPQDISIFCALIPKSCCFVHFTYLKESYVIFLCLGDSFGKELPVYTFRYVCDEDSEVKMNDGTVNIFFNAKKYDNMRSKELRAFFRYLCGKEPDSGFTDRLSRLVDRAKHNAQWRHRYMTWEQEMKIQVDEKVKAIVAEKMKNIVEEQVKEQLEDSKLDSARKMLGDNIPAETVSKYTSLPLDKVLELKKEAQSVKA